jgi:thiol-disulfide isomerase/thioredoxin
VSAGGVRTAASLAVAAVVLTGALTGCGQQASPAGRPAGRTSAQATPAPPTATEPPDVARLIAAARLPSCPKTAPAPARRGGLPDLALDCLGAGPAVTLSALRGTPLLVNVWASWCPPCAQEMPHLLATHRALGAKVRFLGVDLEDQRTAGLAWAAGLGMTFPSVEDPDGLIRGRLPVPAPPVTIFVRPDGQISKTHYGAFTSEAAARLAITEYLGVRA